MICEKCGLQIRQPGETCPRCGDVLLKEVLERAKVESGSLDAWAEDDTDFKPIEEEKKGLDAYLEIHPSAPFFLGAAGARILFYIIGIILLIFTNISFWSGWGVVVNCCMAAVATFLIVFQPEERDFYWFKTITSICVLIDTAITFMVLIWPAVEWIFKGIVKIFG